MTKKAIRGGNRPAIAPPEGTDKKWRERIEMAKEAREASKTSRKGKPTSFRRAVGRAR